MSCWSVNLFLPWKNCTRAEPLVQFFLRESHKLTNQQNTFFYNIGGLVQDCSISIANSLEMLQCCTKPLIWLYIMIAWHRRYITPMHQHFALQYFSWRCCQLCHFLCLALYNTCDAIQQNNVKRLPTLIACGVSFLRWDLWHLPFTT